MRDIDLKTLRLLVAVCDHQSMTRAAEQEHLEASTVSKRIAQLELDLGMPLLKRLRHGVQPTPVGLALLDHARSLLFTMDRITSDLAKFGNGASGHVRIYATSSAIAEFLPEDIATFMRKPANLETQVVLEEVLSRDLVSRMREARGSLGVSWDHINFEEMQHVPCRRDQLVLVVHPKHPLAMRQRVGFVETLAYDHVGLPPNSAVHAMLTRAASQVGQVVRYRTIVSNFDATFRVVAADLGVSVVPIQIAKACAGAAGLVIVELTDSWVNRKFVISFQNETALNPSAQRMLDHIVARGKRSKHKASN